MARCLNCIHLDICDRERQEKERLFCDCSDFLNDDDVVPKSEVEKLQSEVDRLKKDNEYILMQHRFQRRPSGDCWNDVIEKAKTDVVRKIFEEIESFINKKLALLSGVLTEGEIELAFKALVMVQDYIAELKKKYTEGENA